jgi:hypothetical protein
MNEHPKEELTINDNLFLKPVIKDKIKYTKKNFFSLAIGYAGSPKATMNSLFVGSNYRL